MLVCWLLMIMTSRPSCPRCRVGVVLLWPILELHPALSLVTIFCSIQSVRMVYVLSGSELWSCSPLESVCDGCLVLPLVWSMTF